MSAVHRIVPPSPNANLKSFLFGLIAICAALALRAVLAPFLLTSHPYTLLFAATAVASWYGGAWPALFTASFGFFCANFLFAQPVNSIRFGHSENPVTTAAYLFVSLAFVAFGELNRRTMGRFRGAEESYRKTQEESETRIKERTAELEERNRLVHDQAKVLALINDGLRDLSTQLMHVRDEERRRIARDLHDGAGQGLAALSMTLGALRNEAKKVNPKIAEMASDCGNLVRKLLDEVRTVSYLLHPPLLDELGLESAVRWYVEGFCERSKIRIFLDISENVGRLSSSVETSVFRIIQESLTNVHRHSASATAEIRIDRTPEGLVLEVRDDGKGISREVMARIMSANSSGVGVRGMRERVQGLNGRFEIASDGAGTAIRVIVPNAALKDAQLWDASGKDCAIRSAPEIRVS
jgi:signal transduction histidine kinase